MIISVQAVAAAAQPVPAYCSHHAILTPAQWQACWKAGWQESTNGAANAGFATGHNGAPVLFIVIAAILALLVASRLARSGRTATS